MKVKRLAVKAALAASAIPALVMARGHNLEMVPEIPLVVPNSVEALEKTKDAVKLLKDIGAYRDVEKAERTKTVRAGKGKWRNRRYSLRKGPLLVVSKRCEALKAFRNLPGVDINYVTSLNLLRLAPGGHCGRLIVWTEDAFNKLDATLKCKEIVGLPDSKRVINSEEVQGVVRSKKTGRRKARKNRKHPRLNPASRREKVVAKKRVLEQQKVNRDPKLRLAKTLAKRAAKKEWLGKVRGKLDKHGKPRTQQHQPKTSTVKRHQKKKEKKKSRQ